MSDAKTAGRKGGMTKAQAKAVEYLIIGSAAAAIVLIFQPFSVDLFFWGCILVVVTGLAFNLVPFCREGVPFRFLGKVVLIVLVILAIAAVLGILTALAYVAWLGTLRG